MPFTLHHHDPETLQRRRRLSYTWAAIVLSWSVVRTIVVWAAVGDYGLNPWIYLGVDLTSASIDAFSTPRMVLHFVDNRYRRAVGWAVVSLVAFIIPDVYIFLGSRTLPMRIVVIIVAIISATSSVAILAVVRKIRKGRAERRAGIPDDSAARV